MTSPEESDKVRCGWVPKGDALYEAYHDTEWGVPIRDDSKLFEFLVLESAQAGLSWRTILGRRQNYRRCFSAFDPAKVALYDQQHVEKLLTDQGIIRNRKKVEAAVNNARCFLEVQAEHGSFAHYMWAFVDGRPVQNNWPDIKRIPAETPVSIAFSKDLKQRGFKFLGPVICYAHMQAVGMVNDHTLDCFCHDKVKQQGEP